MDGDGDQEWRNAVRMLERVVIAGERPVRATEKASKKERKKRRRDRRRDRRRATLELEQGPSELPPEAPRPDWRPVRDEILARDPPQPQEGGRRETGAGSRCCRARGCGEARKPRSRAAEREGEGEMGEITRRHARAHPSLPLPLPPPPPPPHRIFPPSRLILHGPSQPKYPPAHPPLVTNPNPSFPRPRALPPRPEYLRARVAYLREEVTEALARRRPSSSRQTGSSAPARTATRIRQSALYSDHPRRSRRPSPNKLPVDEHAGEVSSREFEAPTLGQSPPTLDSTHRSFVPTGTATRIRQSALYSDRPRRSRRPSPNKLPVDMHASEVSSSEFDALTLGQSPPTLDSTHSNVGSGALDSTIVEPSALEQELLVEEHAGEVSSSEGPTVTDLSEFKALVLNDTPPKVELIDRSDECSDAWGMTFGTLSEETYSEIIEKSEDESEYDLEEERREIEEYLQANTCSSIEEAFDKILAAERATFAADRAAVCDQNSAFDPATQAARIAEWVRETPPRLIYHKSLIVNAEIESLIQQKFAELGYASSAYAQHSMAPSRDEPSQQWCDDSEDSVDEDTIENGKKWMSEEVMVAFRKYVERSPNLTGLEYNFEELCHQCFNVEGYYKIFHHYNFTVKMKNPSSVDWRVVMYFAEVKEIFGRKYYFCCPLESSENGQCYACNNQGMNDLKHPATGGFDRGSPNTVFPYSSD